MYGFIIILFITLGMLYLKNTSIEKSISKLNSQLDELNYENRSLKIQYYEGANLSEIDELARTKLHMMPPTSFIIVEIQNEQR